MSDADPSSRPEPQGTSQRRSRRRPNPRSRLLRSASIAAAGPNVSSNVDIPHGMGAILLLVPLELIVGKDPLELQTDLGIPWQLDNPVWLGKNGTFSIADKEPLPAKKIEPFPVEDIEPFQIDDIELLSTKKIEPFPVEDIEPL